MLSWLCLLATVDTHVPVGTHQTSRNILGVPPVRRSGEARKKRRGRMAKFIFSAALTVLLLISTSASADLTNGTSRWHFEGNMRGMGIIVGVSGGDTRHVLSWCAE